MKALDTVTTVETDNSLRRDSIRINGTVPTTGEKARARVVIDKLRELAGEKTRVRVESRNANVKGKGLGFSASGFAALGLSTSKALGLSLEPRELSEVVRLGAGSAARSLVGGFSIWYANRNGRSYAEQLASPGSIGLRTLIVPIPSKIKTDRAHADVLTSPFFRARLVYLRRILQRMRSAIERRNVSEICRLAEVDTLNLHAITMTGRLETILVSPLSIRIMDEVRRLREEEGVPVWYSLDTGPSVFINTTPKAASKVEKRIKALTDTVISSDPGGPAEIISRHLF
jgi:phosphomevalonate decarboxylase